MQDELIESLSATVGFLQAAAANGRPEFFGHRPSEQMFAFTEHVWHLRDFEIMAVGPRIDAIVNQDSPHIEEFDGAEVARERRYIQRDWSLGLKEFAEGRRKTVQKLRMLPAASWKREALFHGFGPVTLADLIGSLSEHDAEHIRDILSLGDSCPIWNDRPTQVHDSVSQA